MLRPNTISLESLRDHELEEEDTNLHDSDEVEVDVQVGLTTLDDIPEEWLD